VIILELINGAPFNGDTLIALVWIFFLTFKSLELTLTMETFVSPLCQSNPIALAAFGVRSITLPLTYGPLSVILTTTDFFVF
jgi:hypothetical protein